MATKKAPTDSEKLDALLKLAKQNGWTLPKEIDPDEAED